MPHKAGMSESGYHAACPGEAKACPGKKTSHPPQAHPTVSTHTARHTIPVFTLFAYNNEDVKD
jgi:hypothetical protein